MTLESNNRRGQEIIETSGPVLEDRQYAQQMRRSGRSRLQRTLASPATRQLLKRSATGAKLLGVTRWFWIAEWGALAVAVGLALLSLIGYIQKDFVLSTLVLIVAGLALGVWLAVRSLRHFVERQIGRAFARFEALVARGAANANDWPAWYKQNHG